MAKKCEKKLVPVVKKVLMIKRCHYLCIPKKFVDHFGISPGDKMTLVPSAELITILPMRGD